MVLCVKSLLKSTYNFTSIKYITSSSHLLVPINPAVALVQDAQTGHVSASLNQQLVLYSYG